MGSRRLFTKDAWLSSWTKIGLEYLREEEMPIYYDSIQVGTRRADFIIANQVFVELKAIVKLEDVHLAQGLNYLTSYMIEKGLSINLAQQALK